ncbi:MAG: T9SS type A sorting domain-containing protein, partial [Salinivirgaceae bacterium]|nr:T9SS type A sorting domain-containing protein [Salinivirgaceae bacterium]
TPSEIGQWKYRLSLKDGSITTNYPSRTTYSIFNVTESSEKGFIKIKNGSSRAFAFSNNEPYFPIGVNQTSDFYSSDLPLSRGTKYFEDKLDKMKEDGINYFRLFIGNYESISIWGYDNTFNNNYYKFYNQKDSWQLDKIIEQAIDKGVNVQIVLFSSNILDEKIFWKKNPLNKNSIVNSFENANDIKGTLNSPYDFFTNSTEIMQQEKYIRYVLSRWGYATNLFNIEIFNETNNFYVGSYSKPISFIKDVVSWYSEISSKVKLYDPYSHLITTSFVLNKDQSNEFESTWNIDNIDIVSEHRYYNIGYNGGQSSGVAQTLNSLPKVINSKYSKPYLIGEFAYLDAWPYAQVDPKVYELHCVSWTEFMGGLSTPSFWEYFQLANYSDDARNNSKGISEYTKKLPVIPDNYILDNPEINRNGFDIYCIHNPQKTTIYGYLQDHNFTYDNIVYNEDPSYLIDYSTNKKPSYASSSFNYRVKLDVGANTKYEVKWFNTITGEIYKTENIQAINNQIELYHWYTLRSNRYADAAFIFSNKPSTGWVESEVCPEQWHNVRYDSELEFSQSGGNIYYISSINQFCGLYNIGAIWGDADGSGEIRTKSGKGLIYDKNTQCNYYVSNDNKIYRNYYSNGSGINEIVCPEQWNSIDTYSKLALNASGENIYYVNINKQICALIKNGTTWSDVIISGSNKVADGRNIIYSLNDNCLYYIRSDKEICKLYNYSGSWLSKEVFTGQWTPAHTNSVLELGTRNSIIYQNVNRQLCFLGYNGTSWSNGILCESAVKAKAGSDICYYAKEDCYFYIGEDSYIYRLYWKDVWNYEKLHQDGFGQTPALYGLKIKNNVIYYVGNDYKIHSFVNTNSLKSGSTITNEGISDTNLISKLSEDIQIFPNPIRIGEELKINLPENVNDSKLELFNSLGELVSVITINKGFASINTTFFPSGIYFIIVSDGNERITKKVVLYK